MNAKLVEGKRVRIDMKNGFSYEGKITNVRPGWVCLALKLGGNVHLKETEMADVWSFG